MPVKENSAVVVSEVCSKPAQVEGDEEVRGRSHRGRGRGRGGFRGRGRGRPNKQVEAT